MADRSKILLVGLAAAAAMLVIALAALMLTVTADGGGEWDRPVVTPEDYAAASGPRPQVTAADLAALIDSDDPYVIEIAEHMSSPKELLRWIKAHIASGKDIDMYGVSEHWALPAETLFHRRADCEDSAILIASILTAMGYSPELLIIAAEPIGHVAVTLDGTYIDQFAVHSQPPIDANAVKSILGVSIQNGEIIQKNIEKKEIFI